MARHAPPPSEARVSYTRAAVPGVTPERHVKLEKRKFLVVGSRSVGDAAPGETVELEFSDATKALVEAGHIAPAPKDPRPPGHEQGAGPQEATPADKKGK